MTTSEAINAFVCTDTPSIWAPIWDHILFANSITGLHAA
jgi:hypothetical protein